MKKVILLILVAVLGITSAKATSRTDSEGNTIDQALFAVAEYQMGNFDYPKDSSWYGVGMVASSISHWGRFHVGANINFLINAGVADDWGCIIDFGPSVRVDIVKNVFVNMPVDVVCVATFPEGSSDTHTSWGARIAPSLHVFLSKKFGIYAGPQVTFGLGGSSAQFGMQAGLSCSF